MAKKEQLKQWFLNQQFGKVFEQHDISPALYGAESAVAELLREASDLPAATKADSSVAGFRRLADVLAAFAQDQHVTGTPGFVHLANGLAAALRACNARDDDPTQYEASLTEARSHLQKAWGPDCSEGLIAQSVTDLVGSLSLKEAQPAATGLLVTTPILAGIVDRGLFHLTIELFECEGGGPFCPDLRYLGLTDIATVPKVKDGESFLQAMQEAWDMSGLAVAFRGRWRIVAPPAEQQLKDAEPVFPPRFEGRSAQAATLCALLAATGNPYGEADRANSEQPRSVDPLDLQVAISATVTFNSDAKNPIELQLGTVTSIPKKLSSAAGPLDTFVFQKDQPDDDDQQIEILDAARKEQEQKALPYMGLHIERAETVAEALDLLLVTNRHLRKYQKLVRHEWLKQWEDGTARFPNDTHDGPDRKNQPEVLESVEDTEASKA